MSSPADSILNRIANAVASPFYTRTRNARTAETNEANPDANPDLPPTSTPLDDAHQPTTTPPSTPLETPTLEPLEQLRAAMTLLMQQQHEQNATLQQQRQQQHEQQQQLITLLSKLDVTSNPTTDDAPPRDSSSATAQVSSLLAHAPRVIVPSHLVTDFTTDLTTDVDTFLMQMDEVFTRAGATQPHVKLSFVADFLSGRSNRWWWTTRRTDNIDTWPAFVDALRAHASDGGIRESRLTAFEEMQQQPGQTDREWKLALLDAHNLLPEHDRLSAEQLARKYRVKARPSVARMLNAWVADPNHRLADIHLNYELTVKWLDKPLGHLPLTITLSDALIKGADVTRAYFKRWNLGII